MRWILRNLNFNHKLQYPVNVVDIEKLEQVLQIQLPDELRCFYLHYGSGIINQDSCVANLLLHPLLVIDFINHENDFEYVEDSEIYDDNMDRQIPIIDIGDGSYLTIGIVGSVRGKVMSYDTVIANSFFEFMNNLMINPTFYALID